MMDEETTSSSHVWSNVHFLAAIIISGLAAGLSILPILVLVEPLFLKMPEYDVWRGGFVDFLLATACFALLTVIFSCIPVSIIGALLLRLHLRSVFHFLIAGAFAAVVTLTLFSGGRWLATPSYADQIATVTSGAIGGLTAWLYLKRFSFLLR